METDLAKGFVNEDDVYACVYSVLLSTIVHVYKCRSQTPRSPTLFENAMKLIVFTNFESMRLTCHESAVHFRICQFVISMFFAGCFVQAEVTSISADGVRVHGRQEPISFDYLIIATGSSYAFPAKVAEPQMSNAIGLYNHLLDKVQQAEHILLIGGGPVGVELAAEIGTDFPGKKVTLVHNQPTLLRPGVFNEKLYPRVYEQLKKLGVQMILNDRIELPKDSTHHQYMNYVEGERTFVTERSKQSITADLTLVCVGAHVNNKSILNGSLKSKISPQTGRLTVNNYLQVDGFENIFAVGDICDKEEKMAYLAGDQAKYICKLLPLLHQKKPYPKEYEPHRNTAILLTLGRNGGIGQLPTKGGMLVGMGV